MWYCAGIAEIPLFYGGLAPRSRMLGTGVLHPISSCRDTAPVWSSQKRPWRCTFVHVCLGLLGCLVLLVGQTLPPPPLSRSTVQLHPCRGSFRSSECVAGVSQLHPPKRSLSHLSPCHRGGVSRVHGLLQNPVALQGVEQLHCSVSRYNSPLSSCS